jgi:hypothetical protein
MMVLRVVLVVAQVLLTLQVMVLVVPLYNQVQQVVVMEMQAVIKQPQVPFIIPALVVAVQELLVKHQLQTLLMEVMVVPACR